MQIYRAVNDSGVQQRTVSGQSDVVLRRKILSCGREARKHVIETAPENVHTQRGSVSTQGIIRRIRARS